MESKENDIKIGISDEVETHRAISVERSTMQINLSTDSSIGVTPNGNQTQTPQKLFFLLQIIKPYFNISEAEVQRRVKACVLPKSVDLDFITQKPDLYGPFWIIATLTVAFSLFGNIARYLSNFSLDIPFKIDLIHKAIMIFYSYAIGAPVILSMIGKGLGFILDPIQAISIYGYSLSSSIIISFACLLPSNVLQWVLMGFGFVTSSFHLMNTLSKLIVNIEDPIKYGILGAICACQITLFVSIKLIFLNMSV